MGGGSMAFGSVRICDDKYPSLYEIQKTVRSINVDIVNNITVINIIELNEQDYKDFVK
jgi:hypothetical protein